MPITGYLPRKTELHDAVRTLFDRHVVEEALATADAWAEAWEVQGKTELAEAIRQATREEFMVGYDAISKVASDADFWDDYVRWNTLGLLRGWFD